MATTNGVATNFLYDVLTLSDAAAVLQLPEEVVRAEAEGGRLSGRAVGDGWRFVRKDVLKWVRTPAPNQRQLSAIGSMADDDTLPTLVEDICRRRDHD